MLLIGVAIFFLSPKKIQTQTRHASVNKKKPSIKRMEGFSTAFPACVFLKALKPALIFGKIKSGSETSLCILGVRDTVKCKCTSEREG